MENFIYEQQQKTNEKTETVGKDIKFIPKIAAKLF